MAKILDNDLKLANILAFCVLMQDLEQHSPEYIREKFGRFCLSDDPTEWDYGLDREHSQQLLDYMKQWGIYDTIISKRGQSAAEEYLNKNNANNSQLQP